MDRISSLPDELLIHILSFVPTKYAVGTSVLSSRWINLWAYIPILDLDDSLLLHPQPEGPYEFGEDRETLFMRFLENVVSKNRSANIFKLRIRLRKCHGQTLSGVNHWIQTVIQRNIVECDLDIHLYDVKNGRQYLRIPPSQSLQILKIDVNFGLDMPTSGCFPYLRLFDVKFSPYETDKNIRTELFTSLPRLEKLYLLMDNYCDAVNINVSGVALKSLEMDLFLEYDATFDDKVMIDAPHLEYLHLKDLFLASYLVKQPHIISEVKLDIGAYCDFYCVDENGHSIASRAVRLLNDICDAESLSISALTVEALIFADIKRLPVFRSLTKLELYLYPSGWNLFLHFLDSCPYLEYLVLIKEDDYKDDPDDVLIAEQYNWTRPEFPIPSCLLFYLREVEIRGLPVAEEEKVTEYLYKYAMVLAKITIDSDEKFQEIIIDYDENEEDAQG